MFPYGREAVGSDTLPHRSAVYPGSS